MNKADFVLELLWKEWEPQRRKVYPEYSLKFTSCYLQQQGII